MHLSLLSDGFSDTVDDSGFAGCYEAPTRGQQHCDSLVRGLAFLAVIGVLVAFAFVSSIIHAADADLAPISDNLIHCALNAR